MLRLISAFAIVVATAASSSADEIALVKQANAWQRGQRIPAQVLAFRDTERCIRARTNTAAVFDRITNYKLLEATAFSKCDERVFECAVKRALLLVGPTRFFNGVRGRYAADSRLLSQSRHRALRARSAIPHVLVNALFIDDGDMTRGDAEEVFAHAAADLRAGLSFDAVQKKYWNAYEYSYTDTLSDGSKVNLRRTRVGNYGDFILSEQDRDARPFRSTEAPAEHVQPLLGCHTGDIVVLRDEQGRRTILYRVRDAYSPPETHS